MDGTSASPQRLNAAQRSAHIREVVLAKGIELRQRCPILNHQDALGAGILAFALAGRCPETQTVVINLTQRNVTL